MRSLKYLAVSTLSVLASASLAIAEPPEATTSIEPDAIASVTDIQLDDAFEKSTAQDSDEFLQRLANPTSMDCTNAVTRDPSETCVVTAETTSMPAALAHH